MFIEINFSCQSLDFEFDVEVLGLLPQQSIYYFLFWSERH